VSANYPEQGASEIWRLIPKPYLSRHAPVCGFLLPEQQMLVLPEAIDGWVKHHGVSARQLAKLLDARGFLIRTEKDRLISRKLVGKKLSMASLLTTVSSVPN
jgi:hypothetical protein